MPAPSSTQADSDPTTPPSGSGGSPATASTVSEREVERDPDEDLLDLLELIFVPEVVDKIYTRSRARSSLISATLWHVQQQSYTQEFGDQTTARDRLAHYGIDQPTRLRDSRFFLLLGPPTPACPELTYILQLAERYNQKLFAAWCILWPIISSTCLTLRP